MLEYVQGAGREIVHASAVDLHGVVRKHVAALVGQSFKVSEAVLVDSEGAQTDSIPVVIHAVSGGENNDEAVGVPSDSAAAVIEVIGSLTKESLAEALEKIAAAKRLKKMPAPDRGQPLQTTTMGIVLAQSADMSIDAISDQLKEQNAARPSSEWADMVVIASTCVLNYAVQFPGESISGEILPPAQDAFKSYVPPMYIVPVVRPVGTDAFVRMMSYMLMQLALFSPGAVLPQRGELLEGVTDNAMTLGGYQYDLNGQLRPVPAELFAGRHIPPTPLRIESREGELLGTIQFVPWQDGGVVILKGKLPLEAILLFAGKEAIQAGGIKRPPDTQISNVLPMGKAGFERMLQELQKRSNLVVKRVEESWTLRKIADEGTETPIIGRLKMGVLTLRELVCQQEEARLRFDKLYDPVLNAVMAVRAAASKIDQTWREHAARVESGKAARVDGRVVRVEESVDDLLREEFERLTGAAVRGIKTGMQGLARELGVDIGFLFQKDAAFERGVEELRQSDPELAAYLRDARAWTQQLLDCRNAIEHGGWTLPRVGFVRNDRKVCAVEPQVDGVRVTEMAHHLFNRVACFVEEVTAHLIAKKLPPILALGETANAARTGEHPYRFRLIIAADPGGTWTIQAHRSDFDQV